MFPSIYVHVVYSGFFSEFDRFLADRAAAMDDQPDRRAEDVRSNNTRGGRQMKKQDETENALFAL